MPGDLVPVAEMAMPDVVAELADIRALMGDRSSTYWRDPAMQSRAHELYGVRDGSDAPADPDDQDFITAELRPVGMKEFEAADTGVSFAGYLGALRAVTDVVQGVPDSEQASLIASFNRLPDGVVGAVVAELTSRAGTGFAYAAPEQVRSFANEKGGRVLREWGDDAAVKMARVMARFQRCMDAMSEAEEERFVAWHNGLTDAQAAAVYRKLAA